MNIDDYVKMIAKEEELEEGLEKGRIEGEEKSKRIFVENLLSNTDFTVEKIASLADVTVEFVNQIKNEPKTK
jgi:predicted transposase/invertase (TIGR01784 family)